MRRYCFPVAVFALVVMSSCTNYLEEDARVSFGVDATELSFSTGGESHSVTINSGKKWDVTSMPDWVSLQSINPGGSPYEWIVSFSAEGNNEFGREGKIIIKAGSETADISVSQEGKKGKYIAVESVSLSPTELSLAEGDNAALTFAITPSNASVKDVSWESSSPSVATVSQSGRIDAIAEGTTVITVTTKDGSKTATCTVTVHAPNNVIFYTSTSGSVIEPQATTSTTFGANLISNEYVNGRGVMTFDGDVTIIGYAAFSTRPDLESIHLPNTVVSIGGGAFDHCTSLTSIEFPNSLTNIGESAFESCSSLTSIHIPAYVTSIGKKAFSYTTKLSSISVDSGNPIYDSRNNCNAIIETQSNTIIRGGRKTVIPDSVRTIGDFAFNGSELTSIQIPNSVTTIGESAFTGSQLTSIVIPSSVTSIDKSAFWFCDSLSSVSVDSDNWKFDSRDNCNAIIETSSNTLFLGFGNTVIPNSVKVIGEKAFYFCTYLTSVHIPNSVTRIESHAFYLCNKLKSIEIPGSVERIGDSAFDMCTGLTSVTCYATTPPQIGVSVFFHPVSSGYPIYVPSQSLDAYKTDSRWKAYYDRLQPISDSEGAVDLGLSVKWATCNLGASQPSEYGDYYAWGEVSPKELSFWSDNYLWFTLMYEEPGTPKKRYYLIKKYILESDFDNPMPDSDDDFQLCLYRNSYVPPDNKLTLDFEDDVARTRLGEGWRIPTIEEWEELISQCEWAQTTRNGIDGYTVSSKINGNSFFIPYAGWVSGSSVIDQGSYGDYWSSSRSDNRPFVAKSISFGQSRGILSREGWFRYSGLSIRPVYTE